MPGLAGRIGRRALFALDPETAHRLSIAALKSGLVPHSAPAPDPRLRISAAGLDFANPLGMAAGYDKNAEVPAALLALGFGFVEVGTVTPRPQPGNPRPRIFRLPQERAVINRLGFNNEGHARALERLHAVERGDGRIGVNIGANKDSDDRIGDYAAGVAAFAGVADYLAVNISSPNTPGLRDLQEGENLPMLLARVTAARTDAASNGRGPPLFLKIAPDLDDAALERVVAACLEHGIDGAIVSNTTLSREGVTGAAREEAGGLSGTPLFARSTRLLARFRRLAGPGFALIGTGGVASAEDAAEKIRAGADLVQLYTGMIYAGPALPGRILRGLSEIAARDGLASIAAIRDSGNRRWAERPA